MLALSLLTQTGTSGKVNKMDSKPTSCGTCKHFNPHLKMPWRGRCEAPTPMWVNNPLETNIGFVDSHAGGFDECETYEDVVEINDD